MANDSGQQTFLVIENVARPLVPLNLDIGDLYITDKAVAFIRYTRVARTQSLGFIAGGLAGGLAASQGDKVCLKDAMETARAERANTYGLTIRKRTRQYKYSIFIDRISITRLDFIKKENKIICMQNDGRRLEFVVPDLTKYETELAQYPSGHVLYDTKLDPHDLMLGFPSPKEVVEIFSTESSKLADYAKYLSGMVANDKYIFISVPP